MFNLYLKIFTINKQKGIFQLGIKHFQTFFIYTN